MTKKTTKKTETKVQPIFDGEKPVYIIGGGSSLLGFKWSNLEGKQTLVLNTAHRKMTTADAMFFGDAAFYEQWRDKHPKDDFWRFKGKIYTSIADLKGHSRIEYVKIEGNGNTGAKSILLAEKLGAKTVILLGFDGKAGHWHDGTALAHRGTTAKEAYSRYNKEFEGIAKKSNLTIINANEDSEIKCFEAISLDVALNFEI